MRFASPTAPARDAIVVGLGITGSAIVDALARRGLRVLGIDRNTPPHTLGSSHGKSRIIREAYFEHPLYVPLVRRAYELWQELEVEAGTALLRQTGLVSIGPAEGQIVAGARESARRHAIVHQELTHDDLRRRWPLLVAPAGSVGLFEARAGMLHPERCLDALLARARAHGAELRMDEPVLSWTADGGGAGVSTPRQAYAARTLVLATGPWLPLQAGAAALPLVVERQVSCWFGAAHDPESLRAERCPIVLWEHAAGRLFYTTPDLGDGLKAALHHGGETTSPDRVRPPDGQDEEAVRALLARLFPAANGPLLEARTCLYTNTPDQHFLLDRHPEHERVVLASPCSGHGFKFAPAIGEAVAGLLLGDRPRFDLGPFALARFQS